MQQSLGENFVAYLLPLWSFFPLFPTKAGNKGKEEYKLYKCPLEEAFRKDRGARPKREQRKRERASSGIRKSAALSRLVAKRLLARLARAREFVTKFLDEEGEVFAEGRSNYNRKHVR